MFSERSLATGQELTVQVAARQLQSEAQALGGGALRVDPDVAGPNVSH